MTDPSPGDLGACLSEALDAIAADPDGEHSLDGTLAAVREAAVRGAGARHGRQREFVDSALERAKEVGDTAPVVGPDRPLVEVGCGVGGLLARLDRPAVGVDASRSLLSFARGRTDAGLVQGDPARPPVPADAAGAVVGLGYLTAHVPAADLFAAAAEVLAPGGVVLFDAATAPATVLDDEHEGRVAGYEFRRTVVAGQADAETAEMGLEYELTAPDGRSAETSRHQTVRLYDEARLRRAATAAGLTDVRVTRGTEAGSLAVEGIAP